MPFKQTVMEDIHEQKIHEQDMPEPKVDVWFSCCPSLLSQELSLRCLCFPFWCFRNEDGDLSIKKIGVMVFTVLLIALLCVDEIFDEVKMHAKNI